MHRTFIILAIQMIFFSKIALCQKSFITCPEVFAVQPRLGILAQQNVNVIFFNSIIKPDKLKEDCPIDTLINDFFILLKTTYPDANFTLLPSEKYYLPSDSNSITIKILLKGYGAITAKDLSEEFKLNGGYSISNNGNVIGVLQASFTVFYPLSNQLKKEAKDIESIAEEQPWMTYTKTAIKANNAAFKKAYFEMTTIIDNLFLK